MTIPNPEDGEYKILTQGIADGEYRIEATKISKNLTDPTGALESTATFNGVAEKDIKEELKMRIDGENVSKIEDDNVAPTTKALFTGNQGTNRWYTSDVEIDLSADDNENGSGIAQTKYSLLAQK